MDIIEVKQKKATWLWLPEGKREVCVSVCVWGFELNNYILPSVLKRPWTITYFSLSLFSRGLWSLSWPLNTHRCFFSFSVSSFQSAGLVTVAVLPQHKRSPRCCRCVWLTGQNELIWAELISQTSENEKKLQILNAYVCFFPYVSKRWQTARLIEIAANQRHRKQKHPALFFT